MYKKQIEEYFELNKEKMLQDICSLIKIKSDKEPPIDGKPFGAGPAKALETALNMAKSMGFQTKNYDNYAGAVDLNEKENSLIYSPI